MYTIPVPRHGHFVWHQLSNFINSVHCFQNRVSFRKITCYFELLRVYHNRDATEKSSWKSKTNRGQTGRELWSQSQRKSFHLEFVWRRHKRPHRITKLIVMLYASRNAQSIFQVIWRMECVNQCLSTWVQKSRRNQRKLENFTRRTKEHPFLVENKSLVIPWKILTFCKCRTNNKRNLNMIFRLAYKKCLRKVPYLQHNVPFNNFYLLHNVTVSRIMKKKKKTPNWIFSVNLIKQKISQTSSALSFR